MAQTLFLPAGKPRSHGEGSQEGEAGSRARGLGGLSGLEGPGQTRAPPRPPQVCPLSLKVMVSLLL